MQKINARVKPAKKKEFGTALSKEFICANCGFTHQFKGVEFGETVVCKKCNSEMYEVENNDVEKFRK